MRPDKSTQALRRAIEALARQIESTPTPELAGALRELLAWERSSAEDAKEPKALAAVRALEARIAKLEEAVAAPRAPRERPLTMGRMLG